MKWRRCNGSIHWINHHYFRFFLCRDFFVLLWNEERGGSKKIRFDSIPSKILPTMNFVRFDSSLERQKDTLYHVISHPLAFVCLCVCLSYNLTLMGILFSNCEGTIENSLIYHLSIGAPTLIVTHSGPRSNWYENRPNTHPLKVQLGASPTEKALPQLNGQLLIRHFPNWHVWLTPLSHKNSCYNDLDNLNFFY
jgi:hypothetical protein